MKLLLAIALMTGAPPRFEQISKEAAQARESNRLEDAVRLYRRGVKLRPAWAEGWWYLGTTLYEMDRCAEAREPLRRLVSLEAKNGPGWALLGLCEYQEREYERALDHLQRGRLLGLGGNKQLTSVSAYHAVLLLTRFEQFEDAFQTLLPFTREGNESPSIIEAVGLAVLRLPYLPHEMPPDKRELVVKAGRAGYDAGARRTADARREFEDLVARYPQEPNVHYAFGSFLLAEEPDAALREFQREIEISPNHVPARLQMAFEYLKRGDADAGLSWAEQATRMAPKLFAARNALGRLLVEKGDLVRGVQELETAVKLAPDSPDTRYALASAYAKAGRKTEAARERAEFQRLDALRRKP